MTEKSPATADKKTMSAQEMCEQVNMGGLRFFYGFLAYILFLVVLFFGVSGTGGGNIWNSFIDTLVWFPLALLASARLANAGYPWWIGIAGIGIFFHIIKPTLRRLKYGYDSEPAIIMLAVLALIIAVLMALPPKKPKPENAADNDTPENNEQ